MSEFYDLFEVYPEYDSKSRKPLYIIEFKKFKGEDKETWTLFKRNFIFSEEQWENMEKDSLQQLIGCECHPYNLFGDEVLSEGCVPNKAWLKWMVDQLNKGTDE